MLKDKSLGAVCGEDLGAQGTMHWMVAWIDPQAIWGGRSMWPGAVGTVVACVIVRLPYKTH